MIKLRVDARSFAVRRFHSRGADNEYELELMDEAVVTKCRRGTARVRGSPITIPFNELFLREPEGNESDIIIDVHALLRSAKCAWE